MITYILIIVITHCTANTLTSVGSCTSQSIVVKDIASKQECEKTAKRLVPLGASYSCTQVVK